MKWFNFTQPAVEPVTYTEAKSFLRLNDDDDQAMVSGMIVTAREYCENALQKALIRRQIVATWYDTDPVPATMYFPVGPVVSVDAVKDNLGHDLDPTGFEVRRFGTRDYIYLRRGSWPVTITYTAGISDTAAGVPQSIRHAMLMHVSHLYDNRSPVSDKSQNVVAFGLDAIYQQHFSGELI